MNSTPPFRLTVPLGQDAHRWAEQFAAEQATLQKGKAVYLNTLAVYAVHSYLEWLLVETALTQGDSWHPSLRAIFNVADLVLPNVGKLECRPLLPGEVTFELPIEVTQDRIGYVAVQFGEQLDQVQLLGFAPANLITEPPELPVSELQSLDVLIDTIHEAQQQTRVQVATESRLIHLRRWLEGIFNEDWQPTGLVLASNLRSTTGIPLQELNSHASRAKQIDFGILPDQITVVLTVHPTPAAKEAVDVRLRLYPTGDFTHLPSNLQLIVLDEAGIACMEAKARSADDWMQLEFSCQYGERFTVRMELGETSITEQFVV